MRSWLLICGMVIAVGCLWVPAVSAQEAQTPPAEATPTAEAAAPPAAAGADALAEDVDVSKIDEILSGEIDVQRGETGEYDPAGRRDPFRSLLEGLPEAEEEERPPGLPGMLIEELTLEGIIQTPSGILAFVQGRDRTSYIIRPGTKLYNGEVAEIQPKKVIFRQQGTDPKQLKPYEEVVRELTD